MDQRIHNLEVLLAENKFDQAKVVLDELVNEKSSDDDHGEMLLVASDMYMKAMTEVNKQRVNALQSAVNGLEELKKAESRMNDNIRVAEVKASLK